MKKIALLSLLITWNSFACGIDTTPIFGAGNYPDPPFNDFAAGDLGIITPELASSYLLVAYRYLNNLPLNAEERATVLNVWSEFFVTNYIPQPVYPLNKTMMKFCSYNESSDDKPESINDLKTLISATVNENKAYFNWRKYRLQVLGLPTDLPVPKPPKSNVPYSSYDIYSFYSNLALEEDHINHISAGPGFNYLILATKRLYAIKESLDRTPTRTEKEELSLWIHAQQQIFMRTMRSSEKARELLAKLPDSVPQLVKDDISYSIAASYLYDGTSNGAKTASRLFADLANKTTYPWHEWAKYLQYRALHIAVNELTQNNNDDIELICAEGTTCSDLSKQAYEGMIELAKNATNQKVKDAATDYLNVLLIRARWNRQTYDALLQKNLTHIDEQGFSNLIAFSSNAKVLGSNEISLWLDDVMRLRAKENDHTPHTAALAHTLFDEAYNYWQSNPKNLAWLWLAVYTMQHGDTDQQTALTKAVLKLPHAAPAFVPLRITLIDHFSDMKTPLSNKKKCDLIDGTLAALAEGGDFSATILLLNARAQLATSLTDFIDHVFFYPKDNLLICVPKRESYAKQPHYNTNYIIANAAKIINTLPPSVLIQIAEMPNLPNNYRPVLYANLWVRSILFNDKNLERAVIKNTMKYNPILTDTINKMTNSKNSDERTTLFLSALLHYPNLSPMINLKLYETWKGDEPAILMNNIELSSSSLDTYYNHWLWTKCNSNCNSPAPTFLRPEQFKEYQTQLKLINNLEGATNYISDTLIALAKRHPHDLRYAKLLARFIQYTKYTTGGSRQAFVTLKKLYPASAWAKAAKYYY